MDTVMPSFNKWIGVGHMTRDVQIKNLQSGTIIGEFGLACNRKFKDKENVLFIDCTAFNKQAEILAQYTAKGNPLMVEGHLELDQWEYKDGNKRSKIKCVVENFQLLGGKKSGQEEVAEVGATEVDEKDIPF